ncbi:MAG: PepSY-associated TM helix domain-containing protein [Pseudomonadota bacterium]|nr:PepSY-associated TM helix domain-containing protein [Pseudomonadota bacterium]
MFASFRLSMTWLHTWFGLVLGFVLMVCFFFGALSVFDREIDRWAMPDTRFEAQPMPSFDRVLAPAFTRLRAHPADMARTAQRVHGALPHPDAMPLQSVWAYTTHRDPVLAVGGEFGIPNQPLDPTDEHLHVHGWTTLDPRTGMELPQTSRKIGSEFFYPMHYSLHLRWKNLGIWIVGFAALSMLAALVSGVVMHRKIFRELFTFRPERRTQRSALDLHNLTGVVALPFHFIFALSGLMIFAAIYFPVGQTLYKPVAKAFEESEAARTGLPHDPAGVAAPLASVDAMVVEAQRRWAERGMAGDVGLLTVEHIGDANAYVSVFRAGTDRIALVGEGIHFKGTTGEVVYEDPPKTVVSGINEFLTGLHLQHFRHWMLRALYFFGGMAGCVCIATGFIFFVEKRKRQHAMRGLRGARWVDALAVTSVTGMVIAALSLLVFNRLLPMDLPDRTYWEEASFWLAWLLAFVHAALRTSVVARSAGLAPAWREQAYAISLLAILAVVLNAVTTGDHLVRTLSIGYWPVAGVDLGLLATALIAMIAARRLARAEKGLEREASTQDGGQSLEASRV